MPFVLASYPTSVVSARLRRAKSASSVQSHLSRRGAYTISPEAHQEAVIAAEVAFSHRENPTKRGGSLQESGIMESPMPKLGIQVERNSSVRFTGPGAVKTRNISITRREAPKDPAFSTSDYTNANPFQNPREGHAPQSNQHLHDEDFVESYVLPEPSSYRKLRKAKSMFSVGRAASALSASDVATSRGHFKRHSLHAVDGFGSLGRSDLRPQRSVPVLGGGSTGVSSIHRQSTFNDEAVQIARDHYLHDLEQQRLKEQPSFLKLGKRRRVHADFRRTVRTSSSTDEGDAARSSMMNADPGKFRWIGTKARSASGTLKKAMKIIFRRHAEASSLPIQHLAASKAYYGDECYAEELRTRYPPVPSPDVELLRRVASRESSLHDDSLQQDGHAREESLGLGASHKDTSSRHSRVSSWTNSTATDTINLPHYPERKRLSIIKEDSGPHQPSSSVNSYAAFRRPVRLVDTSNAAPAQRVYSALQKEIRRSGQKLNIDHDGSSDFDHAAARHLYEIAQSQQGHDNEQDNYDNSAYTKADPIPSGAVSWDWRSSRPVRTTICSDRPTPQQVTALYEPGASTARGPIRENTSTFFPSDTHYDRKTTSPFRRAKDISSRATRLHEQPEENEFTSCPASSKERVKSEVYDATSSESAYSRTSGGRSRSRDFSPTFIAPSNTNDGSGTAVIIMSPDSPARDLESHKSEARQVSDSSILKWKEWMTSEVSSLDADESATLDYCKATTTAHQGLERELAQQDIDDIALDQINTKQMMTMRPPDLLQAGLTVNTNMPREAWKPMKETITSGERAEKLRTALLPENRSIASPQTPSLKSPAPHHDGASLQLPNHIRPTLRSKLSQNSMTFQAYPRGSPMSSESRHTPERAERIRRLQSKSSLSFETPRSVSRSPKHANVTSGTVSTAVVTEIGEGDSFENREQEVAPSDCHGAGNIMLLENVLHDRRKNMRISEEPGSDPAFL